MRILKSTLTVCLVSSLIGTASHAEPPGTELCMESRETFIAALDSGQSADVAMVMDVLLEDPASQAYLATLDMDEARPWFAVLFHPSLVNSIVSQSDARKAQWSALADILEAAYVPAAEGIPASG